jgi:hypothetical protein
MHRPQRPLELMLRLDGLAHQAVKRLAAEKLVHKRPQADLTGGAMARRKELIIHLWVSHHGLPGRAGWVVLRAVLLRHVAAIAGLMPRNGGRDGFHPVAKASWLCLPPEKQQAK